MIAELLALRAKLDKAFCEATRAPGTTSTARSAGQCLPTALLVQRLLGGHLVSTTDFVQSHWFNRVQDFDIDLTGDQFGRPPVQYMRAGLLYLESRVREYHEVLPEALARAELLFKRYLEI